MEKESIDKADAIIGLELFGFGRKILPYIRKGIFLFDSNRLQHTVEQKAMCVIKEPKKQTVLPYQFKELNLKWKKREAIYGSQIYCECEKCKQPGTQIHRRYLKAGKKHGQSVFFKGENSISIVFIPSVFNKKIESTKRFTLEKISKSRTE